MVWIFNSLFNKLLLKFKCCLPLILTPAYANKTILLILLLKQNYQK